MELQGRNRMTVEPKHPGPLIERVLMRNHDLTLPALAAQTHIDQNKLRNIIAGAEDFAIEERDKMRIAFGRAADRLFSMQVTYTFFKKFGRRPNPTEKQNLMQSSLG